MARFPRSRSNTTACSRTRKRTRSKPSGSRITATIRRPCSRKGGISKSRERIRPRSQLLETRAYGAREVARGLGIFPAELLLVESAGSSLTYQNVADALMTLCRVTLQPVYLAPIEEALSDLVPGTQAVRFSTSELERLGTIQRYAAYATGLGSGFLTTEQVDRWEGWDRAAPLPVPPSSAPTPAAPAAPEVPTHA